MRRTVNLRWVLRTLARVEWLFNRVDAEKLACAIGAQSDRLGGLGQYLLDVAEHAKRLHPEREQPCVVCGRDIRDADVSRPDARYCSAACRQRAYRARVTACQPGEQLTCHDNAVCDTYSPIDN